MKTWGRKDSSSDEDSTFFGPKAPDPVLGKDPIDDDEDADTMTILAEGTRETFCPESGKRSVEETPEESGWLPDCCNKNTTIADDQASTFSTPTWFSGTADEKIVEAKATEFANSVDEVSREVNKNGASDRALAEFDEVTEESKELVNEDLPVEDDPADEVDGEIAQRQASRSPSSVRKKRGFAALMASMFPGSSNSESQEQTRALDLGNGTGDEEAPKQDSMKIVGVSDGSADEVGSYADKDDNTPEGIVDLIPLDTHDISGSVDPETGVKTIDRDSETENASDIEEESKPSRRTGCKRFCCLAVLMVLLTVGLLGVYRPGKISEIGSFTSRSIETGSASEGTSGDSENGGEDETIDGEAPVEETEGEQDVNGGNREFPDMDGPDSDVDPEAEEQKPVDEESESEPGDDKPDDQEEQQGGGETPGAPAEPEEQEPQITIIPPLSPDEEETDPDTETLPPPAPEYFAALSNAPYDEDSQADLTGQLASVDAEFIVHVGNVRSESPDCLYEDYLRAAESLLSSDIPVFVVPGPNDWSVCNDPVAAYDNYLTFFNEFTESNWGVGRVRRHPRHPNTFSWRYSEDIQVLGVDLVGDEVELASKIQETIAWTKAAFRNFKGTRVFVFAYSTPDAFVERLEQEVHVGLSITYVNGVDAADFGPSAYKVSTLPVLVEL